MAQVQSTMLPLQTKAFDFTLSDGKGVSHSLQDLRGEAGTLIIFMCNHCPFVRLYMSHFCELEKLCNTHNISIIAINPNDFNKYPDDSPAKMVEFQEEVGFNFTYLIDESQETAKKYQAMCTPDSYLFDKNLELFYRGQLDTARPSIEKEPTLSDIKNAINALASQAATPSEQVPSIGCNIKWKEGNAPSYF